MLLNTCKDIGLAVNTGETKYMEIGRIRDMIANEYIRIGSNSYEKVKAFKYLGSLVTYRNSIQEEIKFGSRVSWRWSIVQNCDLKPACSTGWFSCFLEVVGRAEL